MTISFSKKAFRNRSDLLYIALSGLILVSFQWEASAAGAQQWTGYLIDMSCARDRLPSEPALGKAHTRRCLQMPSCDKSGFGVLLDDNEVLRFDQHGDELVRKMISSTTKDDLLRIRVYGVRASDDLQVKKINFDASKTGKGQ